MSDLSPEELDELIEYGNAFSLIVPLAGRVYKVVGWFLEHKSYFSYEYTRELGAWLSRNEETIKRILDLYTYEPSDAYRGVYTASKEEVDNWRLVVQGWVAMLSGDSTIMRLAEYESLKWKGKYVTTLFVFPRSSNVTVTYFDVWTTKPQALKNTLNLHEGEGMGEGYWYIIK